MSDETPEERFLGRILAARDNLLCEGMREFYQQLSADELDRLWGRRDRLSLGPKEFGVLRNTVREARNIVPAPPSPRLPPDGKVDWWSRPRDEGL